MDKVSEEELAAIADHLRGTIGEPPGASESPPRRPAPPDGGATSVLRFVGGFVLPGLILVAILIVGGLAR